MVGVRKLDFSIASIFGTCVEFVDFLFLDEFITVSLVLLPIPTISLSLTLNAFGAKSDDLIAFNNKINGTAILLKPWMKY